MNNPSPLVPQGSLPDKKNNSRKRVEITVFVVLAIHGIGLLVLLMQGCQKAPESPLPAEATNSTPAFAEPATAPSPATNIVSTQAPPAAAAAPAAATTNPTPPPDLSAAAAPAAAAGATEYTIASGDTLGAIARKNHVSLKALEAANPGIDPTKLKIGQKIQIPAPASAPATAAAAVADAAAAPAGGEQAYTVKSGDMLSTIAHSHGVSLKALRSANNLKTDQIRVGQKLTIPAKTAAAPAATPDSTTQGAGAAGTTAPPSR